MKLFSFIILFCLAFEASTQDLYPSRPIRLYVGFAPGGGTDIAVRIIVPYVSIELGQSVVIENRPGVGGNIATDMISKSQPDGYQIMLSSVGPLAYSPHIYKLAYDPLKDVTPIGLGVSSGNVLIVNPQFLNVKTLAEYVAVAQKTTGGMAFGSSGSGSAGHLAGELFGATAKIQLLHISYRGGGPAINDLIGGTVPSLFSTIITAKQLIDSGKLNALAVTSSVRIAALPNVPTAIELGYKNTEFYLWIGMFAPAKTPDALIQSIRKDIHLAVTQENGFSQTMQKLGYASDYRDGIEFTEFLKKDSERIKSTIQRIGKVD